MLHLSGKKDQHRTKITRRKLININASGLRAVGLGSLGLMSTNGMSGFTAAKGQKEKSDKSYNKSK